MEVVLISLDMVEYGNQLTNVIERIPPLKVAQPSETRQNGSIRFHEK